MQTRTLAATAAVLLLATTPAAAQFATTVVDYQQGDAGQFTAAFDDPAAAVGAPSRLTADGGALTPFYPASDPGNVVVVNPNGSLTLAFDEPVRDNPTSVNGGVDLLIFGNSFFFDDFNAPQGTADDPVATGIFADGGAVEVSADGVTFVAVDGVADGAFPTLAFQDVSPLLDVGFDGQDLPMGSIETDFTIPVTPFDPIGLTASQIVANYGVSGGGAPIDFASTGLDAIRFVRITSTGGSPAVDAISDVVPEPAGLTLLALTGLALRRRR